MIFKPTVDENLVYSNKVVWIAAVLDLELLLKFDSWWKIEMFHSNMSDHIASLAIRIITV